MEHQRVRLMVACGHARLAWMCCFFSRVTRKGSAREECEKRRVRLRELVWPADTSVAKKRAMLLASNVFGWDRRMMDVRLASQRRQSLAPGQLEFRRVLRWLPFGKQDAAGPRESSPRNGDAVSRRVVGSWHSSTTDDTVVFLSQ